MERPTFDVLGLLDEPGRPVSVVTVTGRGRPALAMLWFLLDDDRLWFHTAEPPGPTGPFLRAARARAEVAAMVATFNPPADVRQVRMDAQVGTAGDLGQLPPVVNVVRAWHGRVVPGPEGEPNLSLVGAVGVASPAADRLSLGRAGKQLPWQKRTPRISAGG